MSDILKRYKTSLAVLIVAFFAPILAFARTKWFAREELLSVSVVATGENVALYALAWGVIALVLIAFATLLEKKLPTLSKKYQYELRRAQPKAASIFSILAGAFLLIATYNGFLFSPNLVDIGALHTPFLVLQAVIGAGFVIGFGIRTFSLVLIALWIWMFFSVGMIETLENLGILGVAIFTLIYGRGHYQIIKGYLLPEALFKKYEEYAFPILRVFFGANLLLLGFTEKILNPEYGFAFLVDYQWNFMQNLGVEWYSDYLFVLSAGAVESLIGLVFILGLVTRLNALVLGTFFTIPLFYLGLVELVGHLPHFVIVILFVIFGSSDKWKLAYSQREINV